jgi:hypothetical protein
MKRFILSLVLVSLITAVYSQFEDEKTEPRQKDEMITLLSKSKSVGGYGSISMSYTEIYDRDAFVFGARGSVIFGHIFALGLGGAGFVTNFNRVDNSRLGYAGGYGGLVMEPILLPRLPVHISLPVLVGAGGVALTGYDIDYEDNSYVLESDAFLIVEPGVELEFNVTKFFRFAFGGYYRFTSDIDITEPGSLNGFTFGVNLKFGKF